MDETNLRLACLKQASDDESVGCGPADTKDVISRARAYAYFVFGGSSQDAQEPAEVPRSSSFEVTPEIWGA